LALHQRGAPARLGPTYRKSISGDRVNGQNLCRPHKYGHARIYHPSKSLSISTAIYEKSI
jgi:hypothetical protein